MVATYWAVRFATPEELQRVHSIITLDSPLQGLTSSMIDSILVKLYWFGSEILPSVWPDAVSDLKADSEVIQAISGQLEGAEWDELVTHKVDVYTIGNVNDKAVPNSQAQLPDSWDGHHEVSIKWYPPWYHTGVKESPASLVLVHLAVINNGPHWLSRPQPPPVVTSDVSSAVLAPGQSRTIGFTVTNQGEERRQMRRPMGKEASLSPIYHTHRMKLWIFRSNWMNQPYLQIEQ